MRRLIFLFILLLIPWRQTLAKIPPPLYCEGHGKKIITAPGDDLLFGLVQAEFDRYSAAGCDRNGRYEICLDVRTLDGSGILSLLSSQVFQITNTSTCEVVVGFLNARRSDDSTTPIIQVHGSKVTIFQPTLSNLKKAITFDGNNHKLIGGTISGVPNQADSLCVDGTGNNITVQDTTINDCVNAVTLNGDNNRIQSINILFSYASTMPPATNYNLDLQEERDRFIQDFQRWQAVNLLVPGTCLDVSGQNAVLQNISANICNGVSARLAGSGHRILNSQIVGDAIPDKINLPHYAIDCLSLQSASNVTLEGNTFSHCQTGVHVADSNKIFIGPSRFEDFTAKKNDIHNNDYAIHVEHSQTVYARHNSVHENGFNTENQEEFYHFGLWLVDSNTSVSSPKFEPADGHQVQENEEEYPVVKYDAAGSAFIDVKVPLQTGKVEFGFPEGSGRPNVQLRYQSSLPFADCSFSNAEKVPGTSGAPSPEEPGTFSIRCPIQVTSEIKGKRLLAILHGNPVGSSQYAKALGVINDPTGIPVTGSAPTTGNMSGSVTAVQSNAETLAGSNPTANAGPGGAGGCGGSIVGQKTADEKTVKGYFVLWYTVLIILLALRFLRRNHGPNRQSR